MKRIHTMILAATFVAAALPAIAQMPTVAPGAPEPSRVGAGTYTADPHHTQVGFTVNHLGFSFYRGIFGEVTGTLVLDPKNPAAAKVSMDIPIAKIVTTSAPLNEHLMKPEFFDAAKFPTAHFESTSIKVSGTTAKIMGNLTLKGVTKAVTLDARFVGAGKAPMGGNKDDIGFEATTTVKRSDFGVSYGIPMVADEVPLTISAAFEK